MIKTLRILIFCDKIQAAYNAKVPFRQDLIIICAGKGGGMEIIMKTFAIGFAERNPSRDVFMLHSHDNYEILYFLAGDSEYVVEGAVYPLCPHDMILIRPQEMHRIYHKSDALYSRLVISIEKSFFEQEECMPYRSVFLDRRSGTRNRICAAAVSKSGIGELFERMKKYTDGYKNLTSPVIRGEIIELLHLLNSVNLSDSPRTNSIQEIIAYINGNYQNPISLSSIAEEFYISREHLSRLFKKSTGYTLSGYVNHKRIIAVGEGYRQGATLGDACICAGFNDYTAFYRAIRREYGISPREWFSGLSV